MKKLNEELTEAQWFYLNSKRKLKEKEADLWTNTNWEEALGNKKPTQKDKEHWITLQTIELRDEMDEHYVNFQELGRKYEIEKLMKECEINACK